MAAHGTHLAVEIGSSSSAAVLSAAGRRIPVLLDGAVRMPSGVFVDPDTGLLHPGTAGWSAAARRPDCYISDPLSRLGGDRSDTRGCDPVDLVAAVLRHVATHVTAHVTAHAAAHATGYGSSSGRPDRPADGLIDGLTVSIPARFGPRRHPHLYEAATRAGLPAPRLVTAAAAVAAHVAAVMGPVPDQACLLVCHLDAGPAGLTVLQHTDGGYRELAAGTVGEPTGDVHAALIERVIAPAASELARRIREPSGLDDQRVRWHVDGHLWAAVRALNGGQPRVALLLPDPHPPTVLDRDDLAAAVRPTLDALPAAAADLLTAADVEPAQLAQVIVAGESAGLPGLADAVPGAAGRPPTVLSGTPHALADGALLLGGRSTGAPTGPARAASARLPRTRLRLVDLVGFLILTVCSALLLLQAVATAWTQGFDITITAVYLATEQVAAAAAYAGLAALAVAHLAPTVWLSGTPPDPASEPTTGHLIRNAYLAAAAVGLGVAALQGLAAGVSFGRTYLTPAMATAVPIAACTLIIALAAPRIPTDRLPAWQARNRPPIAWPALAAVGILLIRSGLGGGFPTDQVGMHGLLGTIGAACLGVATVLTATRLPLIRLTAAPIMGLGYAVVYGLAAAPILVIGYLCAVGWWTLGLTIHTLRAAFPAVGATIRRQLDGEPTA
jgi:hypothetical protein